jgi:nucleotide-binding universal stress UspA family protein
MYKKILVPLDGSNLAKKILPQVSDLAKCMKAHVVLLNIGNASHLETIGAEAPAIASAEISAAFKEAAEESLSKAATALKKKGLKVTTVYGEGMPAQEIIKYATKAKCDLIAMATHGSGEVAWVLGSVTEKVVSHASVPVLVMRVMKAQPLAEKRDLFGGP